LYSSSGNENLEPEKSKTYEIGFAANHKIINSRLTYFYRETNNGLDFNYINFTYFNFIKQIVRGIEWESVVKLTEKSDISFNYTYLHANERTQSRKTFNDTSYNHLLRRPEHTLNLNAGMQFTKALYASVNAKYLGSRYDVGAFMEDDLILESYFLFGAHAAYKFSEKIKAFVDAQNITGKKFFDVRGYNSIPFMVNAGLTLEL
jgi:vitamin B12 transporter